VKSREIGLVVVAAGEDVIESLSIQWWLRNSILEGAAIGKESAIEGCSGRVRGRDGL
jgi:hypothetical protein